VSSHPCQKALRYLHSTSQFRVVEASNAQQTTEKMMNKKMIVTAFAQSGAGERERSRKLPNKLLTGFLAGSQTRTSASNVRWSSRLAVSQAQNLRQMEFKSQRVLTAQLFIRQSVCHSPCHGNETHIQHLLLGNLTVPLPKQNELLNSSRFSHRDDQTPAFLELGR
jgi:hypothetical protein